jgi:streptomycin 3"-adenylyltransferase
MNNSQKESTVCGWANCPEQIKGLINNILKHYRETLGDNLIGFYLHGSLAMNCFNPVSSDVDFLAIVKQRLTIEKKKAIVDYLLRQYENLPVKDIEMSIVLERYLKNFVYPTPYELHYSNEWYQQLKSGQADYVKQNRDEDLAAHFVITRNRGICLFGKPIEEVFPEIPKESYIQSLLSDANWICQYSEENPLYTVLNLCRTLAFQKGSKITSKKGGGEWALLNLPGEFSSLISSALSCYSDTHGNKQLNIDALKSFVEYSESELDSWQEG